MNEEWVIRAGIAIMATTVGAILRPWISHLLVRRTARKQEQRAMIESWLEMERRKCSYALASLVRMRQGADPKAAAAEALAAFLKPDSQPDELVWPFDPERVESAEVTRLVEKLNEETKAMLLATAELARTGKVDGFEHQVTTTVDRCEDLRGKIVAAMARAGL